MAKYTKIKKQAEAILKEAGITNVEIAIEDHYNGDYDRTDYYICGYYEDWTQELTCHSALIDKWFGKSAQLFCMFFTQRADWLKATTEVKKHCWDNQIHPAMYKAAEVVKEVKRWKKGDSKDYSAKIEYWSYMKENATNDGNKAYAQRKLDYFSNKQQELLTANC